MILKSARFVDRYLIITRNTFAVADNANIYKKRLIFIVKITTQRWKNDGLF